MSPRRHVLNPFGTTALPYLGDFAGSSRTPAKWLHIRTSHTKSLQMHYVSSWSPFMVMVLEVLGFNACSRIIHVSLSTLLRPSRLTLHFIPVCMWYLFCSYFPLKWFAFLVCCLVLKTHAMSLTHVLTYPCLCTSNIAFLKCYRHTLYNWAEPERTPCSRILHHGHQQRMHAVRLILD